VATKNGNNVGKTLVAHNASPFCAAIKLLFENNNKLIRNNIKRIVKKYFLSEITMNFINTSNKNLVLIFIYVKKFKIF